MNQLAFAYCQGTIKEYFLRAHPSDGFISSAHHIQSPLKLRYLPLVFEY